MQRMRKASWHWALATWRIRYSRYLRLGWLQTERGNNNATTLWRRFHAFPFPLPFHTINTQNTKHKTVTVSNFLRCLWSGYCINVPVGVKPHPPSLFSAFGFFYHCLCLAYCSSSTNCSFIPIYAGTSLIYGTFLCFMCEITPTFWSSPSQTCIYTFAAYKLYIWNETINIKYII